jgi:hypothetical protein
MQHTDEHRELSQQRHTTGERIDALGRAVITSSTIDSAQFAPLSAGRPIALNSSCHRSSTQGTAV